MSKEQVVIRALAGDDIPTVVEFSLRAWQPVFESMGAVLGPRICAVVYPDFAAAQARDVENVCRDAAVDVWVAELGGRVVGFVALLVGGDGGGAEVDMIAVDPVVQRRGVAAALLGFVEGEARRRGVRLIQIATGGDVGHAPARRAYERAGYTGLPLVRYYKALSEE